MLCSGLQVLLVSLSTHSLLQCQVTENLQHMFADYGWTLQNVLITTGAEDFPYEEAFSWVCLPMHTYTVHVPAKIYMYHSQMCINSDVSMQILI